MVSIHAPVKGATKDEKDLSILGRVSIHAPVKGATRLFLCQLNTLFSFNSRTRKGCDILILLIFREYVMFQFTHP